MFFWRHSYGKAWTGIAAALLLWALPGPASADLLDNSGYQFQVPSLQFHNPFDPCVGNCMVSAFTGAAVMENMEDLLLNDPKFPWDYDYGDRRIAGASFARTVVTWGDWARVDAEMGLAKRFVVDDEWEGWIALYARWTKFPWNDYLRTSIGINTGWSYASDISEWEVMRAGDGKGAQLLHYFSPEIEVGLPQFPEWTAFFRFHHRSGAYGLVGDVDGGAHYGVMGLRYTW